MKNAQQKNTKEAKPDSGANEAKAEHPALQCGEALAQCGEAESACGTTTIKQEANNHGA